MKYIVILALLLPQLAMADSLLDVLDNDTPKAKTESKKVIAETTTNKVFRRILKSRSPEQNILLGFLETGDFQKALYQWPSAFERSSFPRTDNGKALYGYLLFQNDLDVLGAETLFTANPKKLSKDMIELWQEAVQGYEEFWAYTNLKWNDSWTPIFGVATEVAVRARRFERELTIPQAERLLRKTAENTWERSWSEWQLVVALILNGKDVKGAKLLKHLQEAENNPISDELMNLTAARMLYQNGYLKEAIRYYGKVSKGSDYWFEAQEELAWAHLRLGQPQNGLAISQSLLPSAFEPDIGPEVLYLTALANLKVCDYTEVSKNLAEFKKRFRKKAEVLLSLKETPENDATTMLIKKLGKKRITMAAMGRHGVKLPRYSTRDEYLYYLIQRQKQLAEEAATASKLYSQSISEGTALVGFQAKMEKFKKTVAKRARASYSAVLDRLKTLADEEITEIHDVLKKMQIVEAELITQLAMAERVIKDSSQKAKMKVGTTGSQARDTLRFPFDGEIWFDEISNYKVDLAKGCQALSKEI